MRKTKFSARGGSASGGQTGQFYHIYNRGIEKRDIFVDNKDFIGFLVRVPGFNRIE